MIRRALAAAVWGDTLSILRNQVQPLEAVPGSAQALWSKWMEILGEDLRHGRLSRWELMDGAGRLSPPSEPWRPWTGPVQRVAVVGEIYTKYCRLGNWDLMSFLASESCEVGVGGVTWYALYYMDSHSLKGSVVSRRLYRLLAGYLAGVQREMLAILREAGFRTLPPLAECKRQAVGYAPLTCAWRTAG